MSSSVIIVTFPAMLPSLLLGLSISPSSAAPSTELVLGSHDFILAAGASIVAGHGAPTGVALRTGRPGQKSVASFPRTDAFASGATVTQISFSYRYITGFETAPSGLGANFSLSVADWTEQAGGQALYTSPHYNDHSYALNESNYSSPVHVHLTGLSIRVSDKLTSRLQLSFWNNDRNLQILVPLAVNVTCAGVEACFVRAPPPPPPPFCARYHPIHNGRLYDPSGPLMDSGGEWHVWEDLGAWSHWTSSDLVHWSGSFGASTHFGADTGSVSPTPSGVYAFWPIMSGPGKGAIGSARATNDSMLDWVHRGATIPMPARINTGYRDPVRAFEYSGKWYVGVGCGSREAGAQFCLFEASDDTLANFTDRGSLYTTNVTFGQVDRDIVWRPTNTSANMMECPDLFPLGNKHVLIGSLYKTNQWWVGTLSGEPPRFTPERVGIMDYGNGYAAKSGSTWVQSGRSRRLVFGFTGWQVALALHTACTLHACTHATSFLFASHDGGQQPTMLSSRE